MPRQLRAVISWICSAALVCGCSQRKAPEDSVDRNLVTAYQLIDSQRTEEAITFLERLLDSEPANREFKLALASAYAHKAGIRVQNFIELVEITKNKLKKPAKPDPKKQTESERIDSSLVRLSWMMAKIAQIAQIYAAIPRLEPKNRAYIIKAIDTLNEIPEARPSDAVYRAVLRAVLVKHDVAEELIGDADDEDALDQACSVKLGQMTDASVELGRRVIEIYDDLAIAFPSKAKGYRKDASEVADVVSNLTIASTSLMVLNEASRIYLKQELLNLGFGKLISCGGSDG